MVVEKIQRLYDSLRFLFSSLVHLGPNLGFRYWRIYETALKNPEFVRNWEQKCRWQSAQLEASDPTFSQMLEGWANSLNTLRQAQKTED